MNESQAHDGSLRVLIIDDNLHARKLIASILRAADVRDVLFASTAEDGLTILANSAPDAIFSDLEMHPMDGLRLTRAIRSLEDESLATIPIIMVTSHADLESVVRARDAGVNEFVAKPISISSLLERFRAALLLDRPFIRSSVYVGPCRRRRATGSGSPTRRLSDGVL